MQHTHLDSVLELQSAGSAVDHEVAAAAAAHYLAHSAMKFVVAGNPHIHRLALVASEVAYSRSTSRQAVRLLASASAVTAEALDRQPRAHTAVLAAAAAQWDADTAAAALY